MFTHFLFGLGGTLLGSIVTHLFGASVTAKIKAELNTVKAEIIAELQNLKSKL